MSDQGISLNSIEVTTPAPEGTPVAVTLSEANCGGGAFPGSSSGPYGRHITSPAGTISYATLDWTGNNSKALLVSADVHLHRCIIKGGEDAVHHNGGTLTITECILEEIDYPADSHSDAYQATSGGNGGVTVIEDSILQCGFRQQNAPIQINVVQSLTARRNYLWGGNYGILGDPGSARVGTVTLEDNLLAWGTQQFGVSVFSHTGSVWWDPGVRPRTTSPYAYDEATAIVGFPGNGTAI